MEVVRVWVGSDDDVGGLSEYKERIVGGGNRAGIEEEGSERCDGVTV